MGDPCHDDQISTSILYTDILIRRKTLTHQSNGMGTAPTHAPTPVPTAAPQTVSSALVTPQISFHAAESVPWTYTRLVPVSTVMWAAQRIVCGRCVVKGAPKRIRRTARRGVPRRRGRVRERIAAWIRGIRLRSVE